MLPKEFKPKFEYNVLRLGGDNDGGYIVEKKSIENSKSLLTLGLGYEWTFEKDYIKLTKNPITCFDHSVNYSSVKKLSRKYFFSNLFRMFKSKYFLKKNFFKNYKKSIFLYKDYKNLFKNNNIHETLRVGNGKKDINFTDILKHKNILFPCFLKIDIEGSEYRILNEIIKFQELFCGLVIEFHNVDLHLNLILEFIKKLDFVLVHIHPQNASPVTRNNIPTQLEITFSKIPDVIGNQPKIPHELDMPANSDFDEIELIFES